MFLGSENPPPASPNPGPFGEQQPTDPTRLGLGEARATPKPAPWLKKRGTCS